MRTKKEIRYKSAPYGHIAIIPKGTPVIPADNLPQGGYWAEPWSGMNEQEESWQRNYGFHLTDEEVENDQKRNSETIPRQKDKD